MSNATNRNRATGRYTDSRLDKPCTCGHPLGQHDAERVGDEQPCHACGCECFTKAKPKGQQIMKVESTGSAHTITVNGRRFRATWGNAGGMLGFVVVEDTGASRSVWWRETWADVEQFARDIAAGLAPVPQRVQR